MSMTQKEFPKKLPKSHGSAEAPQNNNNKINNHFVSSVTFVPREQRKEMNLFLLNAYALKEITLQRRFSTIHPPHDTSPLITVSSSLVEVFCAHSTHAETLMPAHINLSAPLKHIQHMPWTWFTPFDVTSGNRCRFRLRLKFISRARINAILFGFGAEFPGTTNNDLTEMRQSPFDRNCYS